MTALLIFALIVVVCAYFILPAAKVKALVKPKQKAVAAPAMPLSELERKYFGLHFRPVLELKRKLPTLPAGYYYKIKIDRRLFKSYWQRAESEKEHYLKVLIYKMNADGVDSVIAKREVNIERDGDWDHEKFSYQYVHYTSIANNAAYNHVVTPMVEWAKKKVLDLSPLEKSEEIF